ncbi:hypothetical protein HPP92_020834 [Vanilla planifolia]|uniref:Fe2OG dioxygenase domain-containing protein n=1 Tax=Vanilla planifolia TaxID=51239 RepID=A0A835Q0F0_VANPL|nr:hypothetical protein HPP92_020834 [Vanilla planifolia]
MLMAFQQQEEEKRIYEVSACRWKNLKNRRLQNWGGVVHEKGLLPQELPPWLTKMTHRIFEQTLLFPAAINHVLINEYLPDQGIMPHQDGPAYFPVASILSLQAPAVIDFTPHPRLKACNEEKSITGQAYEVRKNDLLNELRCSFEDEQCSLLLMPRSLFIFKDEAYSDYLHGIEESPFHNLGKVVNVSELTKLEEWKTRYFRSIEASDKDCFNRTATRVSLTCRLVPKVCKNLFKF